MVMMSYTELIQSRRPRELREAGKLSITSDKEAELAMIMIKMIFVDTLDRFKYRTW